MQLNTEDTYQLVELIEEVKPPLPFYLNRYFGDVITFDTEEIMFEYVLGERRMAPFVSPLVEGRVMRSRGSSEKAFKPAYVKPKHVVEPGKMMKRRPGESLGGSLSPAQRRDQQIMENFVEEDQMLDNRLEWMALQALKTGQVIIEGEDYPRKVVDFGRDAALTITGDTVWSDIANATPLTDLQDAATLQGTKPFGAMGTDVYMSPTAFGYFKQNAEVKDLLDTTYRGSTVDVNRDPRSFSADQEPQYMGRCGQFNIYVDDREYEDDAGDTQKYLATNEVLLISPMIRGAQCFGAIKDDDALMATRSWPKTWVKQDPSVRMTMTQSAPLVVPRKVNCSALIDVL